MVRLERLINELCHDGVEFKELKEVLSFRNGKGHEKNIVIDGKYIVINSKFISTDGNVKKYSNEQICPLYKGEILMVMSDLPNGKALAKCFVVDEDNKYSLNQRICALRVINNGVTNYKYLYYFLNRNQQLLKFDNGVDQTNLKKDSILKVKIPVPPLEVQEEIVRILDNFTELTAELTAELTDRQKQYAYYRDYLLSFDDEQSIADELESIDVKTAKRIKLEDICEVYDGTHQTPKYTDSGVKFVSVENIKDLYGTKKFISVTDFEKYKIKPQINDVLMTRIGDIGTPAIVNSDEPLAYYVSLALLRPNTDVITAEYLYHYISSKFFRRELNKHTIHTAVPIKINKNDIGKCFVNVPSIETQSKIVSILDRFDKLCNGFSEGLPAEIKARKKQYEYYRDALLSFDEKLCSQIVKVERAVPQ